MKTVILSGGMGYRLKEETEYKPKPMITIGGKPILWHIMKIYAHYGFTDFIIALGYKGDYIKDYFLNQQYFTYDFTLMTRSGKTVIHKRKGSPKKVDNFKITFVETGLETPTGERILRIRDFIPKDDKEFMVTYGDGVSDVNIRKLLAFHRKQKTIGTITGVHPTSRYGMVRVGKNGIVDGFIEKPVLNDFINGGFMVFKKQIFDFLKPGEMDHAALRRLVAQRQLSLFVHDAFWFSLDTYRDFQTLNAMWESKPLWKIWKT